MSSFASLCQSSSLDRIYKVVIMTLLRLRRVINCRCGQMTTVFCVSLLTVSLLYTGCCTAQLHSSQRYSSTCTCSLHRPTAATVQQCRIITRCRTGGVMTEGTMSGHHHAVSFSTLWLNHFRDRKFLSAKKLRIIFFNLSEWVKRKNHSTIGHFGDVSTPAK